MKKLFFILFLICNGLAVLAQDTVRYQDPWYKFNPMPPLQTTPYEQYYYGNPCMLERCFGCHVVRYTGLLDVIYGIAFTVTSYPEIDSIFSAVYIRDFTCTRDTQFNGAHDYNIVNSQFTIDTINWARSPLTKHCMFEYEFAIPSPSTRVVDCYEFYFDEPIINYKTPNDTIPTNDTFYIGRNKPECYYCPPYWTNSDGFVMGYDPTDGQFSMLGYGNFAASDVWWISPTPNMDMQYDLRQAWGMAFPIIGLRCTAPRGLRVNRVDSLYTAVWNEDEDAELFQLSMCSGGQMPEDGNIVTVSGHSYDLGGWVPDSMHHLYLRKQCDYSTPSHSRQVWSDWSRMDNPKVDSEEDGIATVAVLDFELLPNPAQEWVTLVCTQARGGTVSVVDMQGRTLLTQAAKATTVLDISTLSDGPYLVRIVTPAGTATRKLSVVR